MTINLFVGLVSVRFINGQVELLRGSSAPVVLGFDEFEDLLQQQTSTPVWQHQTALGWVTLDLLRELITAQADAIAMIDQNLESTTVRDTMCDPFPGAPIPGALSQGMSRFNWLGSGRIQNGDSFAWEFTSCWLDTATNRDFLLDGRIDFRGLSTQLAGGSIRRIGFESVGTPGGMLFDDLDIIATVGSGISTVTVAPERSFTLDRGVRIFFEAP
jgi:hypothetical protein